ncbi:unnamed protein product [Ranitomeya imitator]|uniref:Adenosine 3'-phospho 5'-phosphosulfate transporter 2 n=1 Tax=Ranitomeya imitator TaxID=111125 RepID=A0ABN9MCH5_9NEOB|nr:unnamed protein product [Ranitomeya imitator]
MSAGPVMTSRSHDRDVMAGPSAIPSLPREPATEDGGWRERLRGVLYSYSIGFVYILLGLAVTSGLTPAVSFCSKFPFQTYGYAFFFSLTGYFGISFVLALIKIFGALAAVTVTTGRKAMTIVLSFLFFSKPFTIQYIWSGLLVVLGIFLNVYSKNMDKLKFIHLYNILRRRGTEVKSRTFSQTV